MTRPVVRCRCGHRVLAKEVLRTDLYERPSGREYVYVKYRCKRCKRLGETFVAESRWDWRIFEATRNEMSEAESDSFAGQSPISTEEILAFHCQLNTIERAADLAEELDVKASDDAPAKTRRDGKAEAKGELKSDLKNDSKNEPKARPSETGSVDGASRDESTHRRHPPRES